MKNGEIINFTSDEMNLTKDQLVAKGMMMQMHKTFVLKGYAGTGKTFLMNDFIKGLTPGRFVVTAPTHKAVSVANGDSTIHSYLGLKIAYKEDKKILKPVAFGERISYGETLIIDESSMLSRELLHYIFEAQEIFNIKIIFIGDYFQIPPVNEKESPVWKIKSNEFTLKSIVRQAEDSAIISLATAIRNGSAYTHGVDRFVDNKSVFTGGMKELNNFYRWCLEEDEFPQIISHRNTVVDNSNKWARNIVKDNPTEQFIEGENVYIRSSSDKNVHNLEDIVTIYDLSDPYEFKHIGINKKMNIIEMSVKSYKGEETLLIPATDIDAKIFVDNKQRLAIRARKDKYLWRQFWDLSNSISEVKHIYSMTCHRSQGSTFKNVIVNCNDIHDEKLMYTAVTRASNKLFLFRQ